MEAIGLNPIRLDAIGIDPIRLNAIRLGVPGASSGSDRPYIAPEVLASLVAVVKCDGKSNNDPDRAIIKNLVDPDNPFVISNAAYKLNSGYGKYEEDFSIWKAKSNGGVKFSSDGTKIETLANNFSCQYEYSSIGRDVPSFKVKISNFTEGTISYYYRDEDGNEKQVRFGPITVANSKGIIELPKSYNTVENGTGYRGGFTSIQNTNIGLTIEQIPSFQGALVTDGVDDLIVSQKSAQEMLGGSNEITVVSMINTIVPNTEQLSYTNAFPINGVNVAPLRNKVSNTGKTGIYGYTYKNNAVSVVNNILGDKNDYEAAIAGETQVDDRFEVTRLKFNSSVAWYWTFIANRVLTSDEINQIIAYYNLDKYVKPDIYYDVKKQGLSNNTPDADWYLKDFSGNGRDMQLYNFIKKLGSGIGKYEADYSTWIKVAGVTSTPFGFKITGEISSNYWLVYAYNSITPAHKVKVSGIPEGGELRYASESIKLENGINELPEMEATSARGFTIRQYTTQLSDWTGLSVEQIPDYEGALVTDAVDDYGKVENLPIYKDYTVVADREIVDGLITNADGGVATRGTKWDAGAFCFDYTDGVYSFGATNGYVDRVKPNRFISYMSKYIHNGITTPVGDAVDNNPLCIAKLGSSIDRYSKLALWSLLLFPYTLSEFLLERQLKRYKLGTLYPDMVEFRPIIKSNSEYSRVEIFYRSVEYPNVGSITAIVGNYYPTDGTLLIKVFPNNIDEVSNILVNGKLYPITYNASNKSYQNLIPIAELKSPQKIDITIDEYIRYEDIVQPYPFIIPIIDTDGKEYTYGDKIKVGTEIRGGINGNNLLPELYKLNGYFNFNGAYFSASNKHVIGKTNVFELTNAPTYLKANEPNCIADPQRLRIPNSSYKILGYIPDISGHGNHLKINNSAYAGMSGANGYTVDWSGWTKNNEVIITDSKITFPKGFNKAVWFCYTYSDVPAYKINVQGLPDSAHITYGGIKIHNGINELIGREGTTNAFGFIINQAADLSNLVIEQIGEYEGSFCLDGVEDYLTIPTLSHGAKQVLMKVNWQEANRISYDQRNGNNNAFAIYTSDEGEFAAYNARNNGETYIDGVLNSAVIASQLKDITHNITITNNNATNVNTISPIIGRSYAAVLYSKMALFTFMSFDDISSEDEIKELNDIVGIEGNTDDLFNENN